MTKKARFVVLGLVWGLLLGMGAALWGASPTTADTPVTPGELLPAEKISPWVLAALDRAEDRGDSQTDFLIVLAEQADLRPAYDLPTKQARGRWVYRTLWETAQRSQAPLRAWLDGRGVPYRAYYIVNLLYVRAGDRALVESLAARSDVARIEANPHVRNEFPRSTHLLPQAPFSPLAPTGIEWNVTQIGAPSVWGMGYTGQGIVVGGQDTGYDWDHPALINQYRGWDGSSASHDYNWHDAVHSGGGVCGADSPEPCDDHNHGTHTMGTAVGDDGGSNQIGVAPGARWIGCRNMNQGVGSPATYLECFEFFLAPYPVSGTPAQGDPDLAPDVTNNSWGCPTSEGCSWSTLQAATEAQRAAGIMTVVSAGNTGSSCSTVDDPPSLYDAAYTVGATSSSDSIASFSSRGPVTIDGSGRLKPDISAPGVSIRSSVPGGGYQGGWQGTSMASPHVAGAVALLWSAQPALRNDITATESLVNGTAVPRYSTQCGDPSNTVPNNVYGWGRLDILAAVQQAQPGDGHLEGSVLVGSSVGLPLPGVAVRAITVTQPYISITDGDGIYSMTLPPATYTVSAWKYGYTLETAADVTVPGGVTVTQSFFLSETPLYTLTGCITDAATGAPLAATVGVVGPFGAPITQTTAPQSTGCYTLSLHGGPYTVTAQARLHQPGAVFVDLTSDRVQNLALNATTTDGLLWGYVSNRNTGGPAVGATVHVAPGDVDVGTGAEGAYEVQLPSGVAHTVTVSAPLYSTTVATGVTVPQSNLARWDVDLAAARVELFPPSAQGLSADVAWGQRTTRTLTISSTGSRPLTFAVAPLAGDGWVWTTPLSGTVPVSDARAISVTFDAAQVADWGVHETVLRIASNDPGAQPILEYPVRMTVAPPPPTLTIAKRPSRPVVEVGLRLTYTLVVTNTGGPASNVAISDPLPLHAEFAAADTGGGLVDGSVTWSGLTLPAGESLAVSYGVTITCVSSGTAIVNDGYRVTAAEWSTPSIGSPVTVTAAAEGVRADFTFGAPVLLDWPVAFSNLSQNGADYRWAFGDGAGSWAVHPSHVYTGLGDYVVTLTATNMCHTDVVSRPLAVETYGVAIGAAVDARTVEPGDVVTYGVRVTNTGTLSERLSITLGGAAWPTDLATDSASLLAGATATATVRVTVPVGTLGGAYDGLRVTVESLSDPRTPPASAQATLTTTAASVYGVALGPAALARSGAPGAWVTYTVWVTNTGNAADTISLTCPASVWTTALSAYSLTLPAWTAQVVEGYVWVPVTATAGLSDTAVVRAAGRGGSAEVALTTTAAAVYRVEAVPVTPPQVALPGRRVTHTVWVTNVGNVTDSLVFTREQPGWPTLLSSTRVTLPLGTGRSVEVYVTLPSTVTGGMRDEAVIRIQGAGESAEVVLTTTAAWPSYKSVSLTSVEGGDRLTYTLVLRGGEDVTATATLTDPLPVHTTYLSGTAQASDGRTVTLDGGALHWSGQLRAGAPVVVQFAAQVTTTALAVGTRITNTASLAVADGPGHVMPLQAVSTYNPGYGLTIEEGALYTRVPTVTLRYRWNGDDDITHVQFSNDGGFGPAGDTSDWLPVTPEDPTHNGWALSPYGELTLLRTVYARFRDGSGAKFGPIQDDILYDPVPPQVMRVEVIAPVLPRRVGAMRGLEVILRVTVGDDNSGVDRVQISHSAGFETYSEFAAIGGVTEVAWELQPSGAVYVRALDRAGNLSVVVGEQGMVHHELFLPLVLRGFAS